MARMPLIGAALGFLAATDAMAQAGPAPTAPPTPAVADGATITPAGRPDWRADMAARRQQWEARRAEREARHEADLALLLDLKPAQREKLHIFLTAMHPARAERPETATGAPATPENASFATRLADMQDHLDRHIKNQQERLSAARAFYASLDGRQQQKFDVIQRMRRPDEAAPGHGDGLRPARPGEAG